MPEYLAPGVFVEEVSYRSRTIEGVPTSTTGFAGMTRYGPVAYMLADGITRGPRATEARLVTSFTDFERVYGGLEPLDPSDDRDRDNYIAHAARAFFLNGGSRLYVARVFREDADTGVAYKSVPVGVGTATWRARWPGDYGNALVVVQIKRSKNVAMTTSGGLVQATGARPWSLVEVLSPPPAVAPGDNDDVDPGELRVVSYDADDVQSFIKQDGTTPALPADSVINIIELSVTVQAGDRVDTYDGLGVYTQHKRYIGRILGKDDPADEDAVVWLDWASGDDATLAGELAHALRTAGIRLEHGNDGTRITSDDLTGQEASPDDALVKATGLYALGEVTDIAIVAAPDSGTIDGEEVECAQALVAHAERERYRIAIVDSPPNQSISEIRHFRGNFDSKYAAIYHPWIDVLDPLQPPTQGAPPPVIPLPPSGFVAGIYARSDVARGVSKAPANEVVQGLSGFEHNINTPRNQVLNPEGINALRFFEGRGNRVWGARTMSSDPEWTYVNVRRLFIYLEHSIDDAMQWAVFEPNNERLWASVRASVEDFLFVEWKNGGLVGGKPDEAYFVRCDRTTMSQNDLDTGKLICLIGVAPVKPAEFVIFRIGQWTADSTLV